MGFAASNSCSTLLSISTWKSRRPFLGDAGTGDGQIAHSLLWELHPCHRPAPLISAHGGGADADVTTFQLVRALLSGGKITVSPVQCVTRNERAATPYPH